MLRILGRIIIYSTVAYIGWTSFNDPVRRALAKHHVAEFMTSYLPIISLSQYYDHAYNIICIILFMTPMSLIRTFSYSAYASALALIVFDFVIHFNPKNVLKEIFIVTGALAVSLLCMDHHRSVKAKKNAKFGSSRG